MIECKFVYKLANGGVSDSLNFTHKVHSVPRVGETLSFISADGSGTRSEIKEVIHYINTNTKTHEIIVYYGD